MKFKDIPFWICFGLVFVNAVLFFASLQAPALHHLQHQHLTMLVICAVAAGFQYMRTK
jgi:hypothetical protein